MTKKDPVLSGEMAKSFFTKCTDGQIKTVLKEIMDFFDGKDTIPILDNRLLDKKLQTLATILSPHVASANKSVAETVQAIFVKRK